MSLREKIITCIRVWQGENYNEMAAFDLADSILVAISSEPAAGPVAVVDQNDFEIWADILPNVSVKVGDKLFTAPPADERDARIAELKIELNKAIQQSLPRRNETDSLRNQLAAAQEDTHRLNALEEFSNSEDDSTVWAGWTKEGTLRQAIDAAIATDQSAAGSEAA